MACCGNYGVGSASVLPPERVHALHTTPLWVEVVEREQGIEVLRRCILAMRAGSAGDGVVRSNVGGEWL
jgi:hypothetical protein